MSTLKQETRKMVQFVLDNPPDSEDALRVACQLHMAVCVAIKMKAALEMEPIEALMPDVELVQKLWGVIGEAADKLFPDAEGELEYPMAMEDLAPSDFRVTSADGSKGVVGRVVSDDADEDCDCPSCRLRVGLVESLIARRGSGSEDNRPDYSERPFWKPPVRKTFTVPGNNTIH